MSASPELIQSCSQCGASIYPEHFERGLAVRQSGRIYCRHCIDERARVSSPGSSAVDVVSLALSDAPAPVDRASGSSLHGHIGSAVSEATQPRLMPKSGAATRIRTFHSKLSDAAIQHLDQQVNSWLEIHPEVEVKFATTTVGMWEGKHVEPNLVLTLFY